MNNVFMFFKLLLGTIAGFFTPLSVDIQQIPTQLPSNKIIAQLQQFESSFIYPFSDNEEFVIKHGIHGDYFDFFKQLGKPYYYVATAKKNKSVKKTIQDQEVIIQQEAGEIAAAVCCILRTLTNDKGKKIQAWYICDLKVNQKYQQEHLPVKIIKKVALARFTQCPRGFAICMNPAIGDPKAASIVKKHGPIANINTQILNLYTLSAQQIQDHRAHLKASLIHHGYMSKDEQLGYISTSGAKDYEIINKVTSQAYPWKLFHLKSTSTHFTLEENGVYMICAVEGTSLDNDFKNTLGAPSSTAQIISYGMEDIDFNFLTSDQI